MASIDVNKTYSLILTENETLLAKYVVAASQPDYAEKVRLKAELEKRFETPLSSSDEGRWEKVLKSMCPACRKDILNRIRYIPGIKDPNPPRAGFRRVEKMTGDSNGYSITLAEEEALWLRVLLAEHILDSNSKSGAKHIKKVLDEALAS